MKFLESYSELNVNNLIEKWKNKLNLNDWIIDTLSIDDNQVRYPDDIKPCEKFFVGINYDLKTKRGTINHARDLIEEDIAHELLHVANPDKSEDWVNEETDKLLKDKGKYCFKLTFLNF